MLQGLMQARPLLVSAITDYAEQAHGKREITSRLVDEPDWRYDYRGLAQRSRKLANALLDLGICAGDRVSSLAWNTHRHMELFFGVTGSGAVLHTANPRLHADQIIYTINHAGSRILFFDSSFTKLVESIRPRLLTVEHFFSLSPSGAAATYEDFISPASSEFVWPIFDENSGAILCYTSGTTGSPKGVLYSHRSIVLHAMGAGLPAAFGLTAFDVVMPCSSLYHATAWGLPFVAAIAGSKFVLPADRLDPESLHELIEREGVTFTGGVPTIWTAYLEWLDRLEKSPAGLRRVVIGGSAVPVSMAQSFLRQHNVEVLQLWGMTETCPLGVVATPTPQLASRGETEMWETIWTRQGRLQFGIELKLVDEAGCCVAHDGHTPGALMVRGPWVVERYFGSAEPAVDSEGWFNTGDVATLDEDGFMRITDRAKDVIKSGGEWISSIDLENAAAGAPGVKVAAVVGLAHPRWDERPLLVVEPHEGAVISITVVMDHLRDKIVRWWLPDSIIIAEVPLTATGKIDKKQLRIQYQGYYDDAKT
ncbi:long-chain fatty acid--CoA ligase [Hyphomonas sp.]|jgi:acyl-CoA synthetase (AMP-forming)/AMP-acid ligase II|uniref:long-chain fatty acid--CoA ligase n=1 Tax=Hyphomonas sp. TaxID=87 RepID=UPI0037C12672